MSTINAVKRNNRNARNSRNTNVQYTVKRLDLDGNGQTDHNLVTMYVNGKVADAKVITTNQIITNSRNAMRQQQQQQQQQQGNRIQNNQGSRVIYRNMPKVPQENKPIIVQQSSSLGQYFKQGVGVGAGATLGSMAMGGLVDGIGSVFGFGNDNNE